MPVSEPLNHAQAQHIEIATRNARLLELAAFVDLSAAYDTVNHRLLIQKLYNIMQDSALCRVIQNLLSNRTEQRTKQIETTEEWLTAR